MTAGGWTEACGDAHHPITSGSRGALTGGTCPCTVTTSLTPEHRDELDMTDEEIHEALPNAVRRHAAANHNDPVSSYGTWDQPLRIDHMHLLV